MYTAYQYRSSVRNMKIVPAKVNTININALWLQRATNYIYCFEIGLLPCY